MRLHTELTKPPRALWVPFELGRPLGIPGDAAFQKRVLISCLKLLEAPAGPLLEDYPEDAPKTESQDDGASCPINFARPDVPLEGVEAIAANLRSEVGRMQPWYDRHLAEEGRTAFGSSTLTIDEIVDTIVAMFGAQLPSSPSPELSLGELLRLAVEDLKAFYTESMLAQPGTSPNDSLVRWFWENTVAGQVLVELKQICVDSKDEDLVLLGNVFLVPRTHADRLASGS